MFALQQFTSHNSTNAFFNSNPLSLVSTPSDHCELVALKWAQGKGSLLHSEAFFSSLKLKAIHFKFPVFPNESTLKKSEFEI